jgi:iron(III) transport system ATP-binding protein
MTHPKSAVTITNLSKAYAGRPVLRGIDLTVPDGSITAVLGSSGCGKTTLLRIVAGFVRSDGGTVSVGDRVVESPAVQVKPHKRGVGYVPQEGALFPHLTVAANILFGLRRSERTPARLREMLELAELGPELADRYPHQLSGGQQQRVAIARALAPNPAVVLLDEPFSSLDAALRASAGRAVARVLRHAGATAMLVTHDQGEALSLADQVALMRDGKFVQVDSPSGIYEAPVDEDAARFVGGASVVPAVVVDGQALGVLGPVPVAGMPDGAVRLVLRPEQVEVTEPEAGSVKASVTDVSYYGAHILLQLTLPDGTQLSARGPSSHAPSVGDVIGIRILGNVLAHPGATS